MGLARLVVVEGPDVGCEFAVPVRGGGIGRGENNAVQLSDLAVSRNHCAIELRGGELHLVDHGSRNRTLVNGKPVSAHALAEGDEISIGKSRLVYLPPEGGVAVLQSSAQSRVTMEVGSDELRGIVTARNEDEARAQRYLSSLADLGGSLRAAGDRSGLAAAACEAARSATQASRSLLLTLGSRGLLQPLGAAVPQDDPEGAQLALPAEVVDRVAKNGKAVTLAGVGPQNRFAAVAPLLGGDGRASGFLYVDRPADSPRGAWDRTDLMALNCTALLVAAALGALERRQALETENRDLLERAGGGELIGSSARTRDLLAFVAKVGPSDATVLLTGESGSGKEMAARAIHRASRRTERPFVAVNCAALTESLIESELFGHEKGAFTGATERKIGRFEAADGGTLFLDEVGELPLSCQTKFLRVLEEQCFERVGGTRPIHVDVRVVAATNRDLPEMVNQRGFRQDLFYRLSVIHTVVPPLRERPEDIPELATYFLKRFAGQAARLVTGFTPEAMAAVVAYPWIGNVRELRNAIERAVVLGDGELIELRDLPPEVGDGGRGLSMAALNGPADGSQPAANSPRRARTEPIRSPRSLKELEREGIVSALKATGGNKAQAAQILEIDRSTLYKKIRDYDIEA